MHGAVPIHPFLFCFVVYFIMSLSQTAWHQMAGCLMAWWKVFGSDHGLMNVLPWDFLERTEENHEYLVIVTCVQTGYYPNVNVEC